MQKRPFAATSTLLPAAAALAMILGGCVVSGNGDLSGGPRGGDFEPSEGCSSLRVDELALLGGPTYNYPALDEGVAYFTTSAESGTLTEFLPLWRNSNTAPQEVQIQILDATDEQLLGETVAQDEASTCVQSERLGDNLAFGVQVLTFTPPLSDFDLDGREARIRFGLGDTDVVAEYEVTLQLFTETEEPVE